MQSSAFCTAKACRPLSNSSAASGSESKWLLLLVSWDIDLAERHDGDTTAELLLWLFDRLDIRVRMDNGSRGPANAWRMLLLLEFADDARLPLRCRSAGSASTSRGLLLGVLWRGALLGCGVGGYVVWWPFVGTFCWEGGSEGAAVWPVDSMLSRSSSWALSCSRSMRSSVALACVCCSFWAARLAASARERCL